MKSILSNLWRLLCPPILIQREIAGSLFTMSLRDHLHWIVRGDEADAEEIKFPTRGHVWDLGANIGLYAVKAAKAGCKVTAFDISKTNVLCLQQTARMGNGFDITAVYSPVTVEPSFWKPAKTGHTEEQCEFWRSHFTSENPSLFGANTSLTYLEAAEKYGLPDFIKFDIQGGEIEFLKSKEFQQWIRRNGIAVYLETHLNAKQFLWPEFKPIGPIHFLIEEAI